MVFCYLASVMRCGWLHLKLWTPKCSVLFALFVFLLFLSWLCHDLFLLDFLFSLKQMQAELGISASCPVVAEVTCCHHWPVSVCARNRGRRAHPSFSVVQQSPVGQSQAPGWRGSVCLHLVWHFLSWVRHWSAWPPARTCQALVLVSDSNHGWCMGEDPHLLPGVLLLLLPQLQTLDFLCQPYEPCSKSVPILPAETSPLWENCIFPWGLLFLVHISGLVPEERRP